MDNARVQNLDDFNYISKSTYTLWERYESYSPSYNGQIVGLFSLSLATSRKKESSEFIAINLRLKTDLVSHPAREEDFVNT